MTTTTPTPAFVWNAVTTHEAFKRFGYAISVEGLDQPQALNFDGFSAHVEAPMPADLPTGPRQRLGRGRWAPATCPLSAG